MRRVVGLALTGVILATACSTGSSKSETGGKLQVVAAENFWGSIAAQLGGDRVEVTNIVSSPDADPHDYEPTPQDGRAVASARYVIFNGLGYDGWARQMIDANPATDRAVLEIGERLGLGDDENQHRWYFPDDVRKVITEITEDYKKLDPANASYYDEQRRDFEGNGLKRYNGLLSVIREKYAGTPVGASESIVVGLVNATGLDFVTPEPFITAVSDGREPLPGDKEVVDREITQRLLAVFIYNSQNATPDVQALVDKARASGVETVTVTETPPEGVTFQDWQADQLEQLLDALARATGR